MKKFFKKIHLWISVPAGLVISITCLTGAILVFEKEILAIARPDIYRCEIPDGREMMSQEEIGQSLTGIHVPGIEGLAEVAAVRFSEKENGCAMVTFKGAGRKTLSVNPYTGEINGWAGFRKVRGCSAHGSAYHVRKAGSVSCTTAMCHWASTACFCSLSWPLPALHGLSAGTAMLSMRSQEPNQDN